MQDGSLWERGRAGRGDWPVRARRATPARARLPNGPEPRSSVVVNCDFGTLFNFFSNDNLQTYFKTPGSTITNTKRKRYPPPTAMNEIDNTLHQMASYAFTAPINATIIFEDSDEDNNIPLTNVKVVMDDSKTNNDNMETVTSIKNISKAPDLPIIDIGPTDQSDNNGAIIDLTPHTDVFTDNNINPYSPNPKQLKRKTQNLVLYPNKLPKQTEKVNNTARRTEQTQHKPNSIQQTLTPQENTSNSNIIDDDLVYPNTNQLTNDKKEMSTYINTLLDTVSEHLIFILKAYLEQLQFEMKNGNNLNLVEDSRKKYSRIKYHYFNLSYCTVLTIIMPQNSNVTFTKLFLNNTIKIAKCKGLNYPVQQIEPLYNSMVLWTKQKKLYLDSVNSEYTNKKPMNNSGNLLYQHLISPPTLKNNITNVEEVPKKNLTTIRNPSKTCILSSIPNGKENIISIQQNPNNQSSSGPSSNRSFEENDGDHSTHAQKLQNDLTIVNWESHAHAERKNCSTGISQVTGICERYNPRNISQPNAPTVCSYPSKPTYQGNQTSSWGNHPTMSQNYIQLIGGNELQQRAEMHNQVDSTMSSNQMDNTRSPNQMDNTRSSCQINNPRSTNQMDNTRLSCQINNPRSSNQMDSTRSLNQMDNTRSTNQMDKSRSSNQIDSTRSLNQMDNTRSSNQMNNPRLTNQMDNTRPSNQVEITRSVSRDSGFISPPNFNTSIEPVMTCIGEHQRPEHQMTPLIKHVTSLNPKASYINYSVCQVCGKITNTMCIGCYKSYYCSNECQIYDWATHMVICRLAQAQNSRV